MPQSKGSVNWLTNERQAPNKRCFGIDQSEEHILNNAVESEMKAKISLLHIQRHRMLVDTDFELKETRKLVEEYTRMQRLAKLSSVDELMKQRPGSKCRSTQISSMQTLPTVSDDSSCVPERYKLATKGVKGSTPLTKGFSSVHIDLGDDEHFRVKQKIRSKSAAPKAPEEPVRVKKVTTRAGLRRPRTAFMPARSNIEIRRAVRSEFTEAADIKQRRPKTSNGIEDGNGFSDPEDDLGARSFQELRNVSQIDKLLSAEKQAQREAYERLMSEKRRREADVLHQRLRRFYQRLDEFKKKSNKHNFNSFL